MSDHADAIQRTIESYKRAIERGIDPVSLATLVDAEQLADIIHDHTDLFDIKTQGYLEASSVIESSPATSEKRSKRSLCISGYMKTASGTPSNPLGSPIWTVST